MKPREEVANVIRFIGDSLTARQLLHAIEQDDTNPDVFTVAAHDNEDHVNVGMVGWHKAENRVSYLCHNPLQENHDLLEGIPEDESKCWWDAQTAETFVWHLTGKVREIQAQYRRLVREVEKELDSGD